MTKALRLTSIVVAAVAVLLVVLPAVFSSGMDEQAKSLLDSPSVLESLKKAAGAADTSTVSPLVQQAEKFAAYLNPPPPPQRPTRPAPARNNQAPIRPAQVSPKFELLGTSYYALRPELSLALIDEPGKGLRWIRQSSEIGHLVVEEVSDGKVVIRDGERTYELQAKRTPKRSLIKGESSTSAETPSSSALPTAVPPSPTAAGVPLRPQLSAPRTDARNKITRMAGTTSQPTTNDTPELNAAEMAIFEQFIKDTEGIEDPDELTKMADELMEKLTEVSQVTDEEAALLYELGAELQDVNNVNDEATSD
jgi:hypothetical protein